MKKQGNNMDFIEGSGGGGGGGGGNHAPNTLRANVALKVIDALCEGEIVGVAGAEGIYLDWTPIKTGDTFNFPRIEFQTRNGTPSQEYIVGYAPASEATAVNVEVSIERPAPPIQINNDVTRVIVTMNTPEGMSQVSDGDVVGSKVEYVIDTKPSSSGAYSNAVTYIIEGKTTAPYERSHQVLAPPGLAPGETWLVRVTRVTPDPADTTIRNKIAWARITRQKDFKEEYNNTALVALSVDAESLGGKLPQRAYLVKGAVVKIPSNFNGTTRTYAPGVWDGTFTTGWTDCPAWCLYDLVTNKRYGAGEFIPESAIDKWSFYDASVYSAGHVPDGKGGAGTEPRFSLNCVIQDRDEAQKWFSTLAGVMRANLIWANGLLTVVQDRPSDTIAILTEANVIEGSFVYSGTAKDSRHTAYNVTWFDRADRHFQKVTTLDAMSAVNLCPAYVPELTKQQNRYGYVSYDIAAFGATTQGQAIRQALWAIDTETTQTDAVVFKMGLNGFNLRPGDIVEIYQNNYHSYVGAGRITAATNNTVTLDRDVALGGENKLTVMLDDGKTLQTLPVASVAGKVVTLTGSFSQPVLANSPWHLVTIEPARKFKIVSIRQEEHHEVTVEGIFHDPAKYDRVERGIFLPPVVYTSKSGYLVGPPHGLLFQEIARPADNSIYRSILISWSAPLKGIAAYYSLEFRRGEIDTVTLLGKNYGEWENAGKINALSLEAPNVQPGAYEVRVYAHSLQGNMSAPVEGFIAVGVGGTGDSLLQAPINFVNALTGSTNTFDGNEIPVKFTNPIENGDPLYTSAMVDGQLVVASLYDFVYFVKDPDTDEVLETGYIPPIAPGATTETLTYSLASNTAQGNARGTIPAGTPRRAVKFEVRARDANFKTSLPAIAIFTNAAPAIPTNIALIPNPEGLSYQFDRVDEPDVKGYVAWAYQTSGEPLTVLNRLNVGNTTFNFYPNLGSSETWYFRVGAYDSFNTDADLETGTNMNVSPEIAKTTLSSTGSTNTGFVYAYKRSASVPTDNPGNITFDFLTGKISVPETDELANGWFKNIPDGVDTLYIAIASASAAASTDEVAGNEFTSPVVFAVNGIQAATIYLYKRNSDGVNPPMIGGTSPANDISYVFSTGKATGTPPSGWSLEIPSNAGRYLWVSTATAANSGTSDIIPPTEWAAARLLASDGTDGEDGLDSALLSLSGDHLGFIFDDSKATLASSPSVATFTATRSNVAGDVLMIARAYNSGGVPLGTITMGGFDNVRTITPAQFSTFANTQYVTVTASLNSVEYGLLTDSTTIYRADNGADTIQVTLSNESHTIPANAGGNPTNYANSGTRIGVYEGTTQLDYDAIGTANGKFKVVASGANITVPSPTESGLEAVYGNMTAMSNVNDTAAVDYTVTGKSSSGVAFTFVKRQSFSKSKSGANAPLITISGDHLGFIFDQGGTTALSPALATFTATPQNLDGVTAATFSAIAYDSANAPLGNVSMNGPAGFVRTMSSAQFTTYPGTQYVIVTAGAAGLSDSTTIYRAENGSDVIQVTLSNQTHNIPATTLGVVTTYGGSGTKIGAYEGTTQLDYDAIGTANGKFKVVAIGTNITPGAITDLVNEAEVGNASGMPDVNDAASIDFTVSGKSTTGVPFSFVKSQSFAKSKAGLKGDGAPLLVLSSSGFAFVFDNMAATSALSPESITFTALLQNPPAGAVTFVAQAFSAAGVALGTVDLPANVGNTVLMTKEKFVQRAGTQYVIVTATLGSLTDTMTVYRANNGETGLSAVQMYLTNESHTIPSTDTGVVSDTGYDNGTTKIGVYEGMQQLMYVTGVPAAGQFKITSTGSNITTGAISNLSGEASVAKPSNMTADSSYIDFVATGKTFGGIDFSLTKRQSFAKSKAGEDGADGLNGAAAPLLVVLADGPGFVFRGPEANVPVGPTQITFTAKTQNLPFDYTLAWSATAYLKTGGVSGTVGGVVLTGSGSARKLTPEAFSANANTHYVKVTVTATRPGGPTLTDTTSVHRANDGANTLTAYLSNESHTIPAGPTGTTVANDYAGSGSILAVYEGAVELQYSPFDYTSKGVFRVTKVSATGIQEGSISQNGLPARIGVASNMTADVATVTWSIIGKTFAGVDFSLQLVQSFAKSKAGEKGNDAPVLSITATSAGFVFPSTTSLVAEGPASITFTSDFKNVIGFPSPTWSAVAYTAGGTPLGTIKTGSTNTFILFSTEFQPAAPEGGTLTNQVLVTATYNLGSAGTLTDRITVYRASNGLNGVSPIQSYLSNEMHTVPASETGVIPSGGYTGSGTKIGVYQGGTPLKYNSETTGIVPVGEYRVTATGSSITPSAITGVSPPGGGTILEAQTENAYDLTADNATITFDIVGTTTEGNFSMSLVQSFVKSKSGSKGDRGDRGNTGPQGPPGAAGTDGTDGTAGPRGSIKVYVPNRNTWSDGTANSNLPAGIPVEGDEVTQYNGTTFVEMRTRKSGVWVLPGTVIDGNALVRGTVTANAMAANSITAANAAISNAAVGTLTIGTNAVTIPQAITTQGATTLPYQSWTLMNNAVLTMTLAPSGAAGLPAETPPKQVLLTAAVSFPKYSPPGSFKDIEIAICRQQGTSNNLGPPGQFNANAIIGALIYTKFNDMSDVLILPISDPTILSPNTTYKYSIWCRVLTGGATIVAGAATFSLLGTKR